MFAEIQLHGRRRIGQEGGQAPGRMDPQAEPQPRLLRGFARDQLPAPDFPAALFLELRDRSGRRDGKKFGEAELRGLLHDEIHGLGLEEGLGENDPRPRRLPRRPGQAGERRRSGRDFLDPGGVFRPVLVEEDDFVARPGAQHRAQMMVLPAVQDKDIALGPRLGDEEMIGRHRRPSPLGTLAFRTRS